MGRLFAVFMICGATYLAQAAGITISTLPKQTRTGEFPLCFNGSGELLPCASNYTPEPPTSIYAGNWRGRMITDKSSPDESCYNADVQLRVEDESIGIFLKSITVKRDTDSAEDIDVMYDEIDQDGYISGDFYAFGERIEYSIQFNAHGYAEGVYSFSYVDCRGRWSFNKD